jgi:hypothetical protein
MACCGRRSPPLGGSMQTTHRATAPVRAQPMRYGYVFFEYVGSTALTVIGRGTGKHYHFSRPGARVAVEPVDQASLSGVPNLRRV